MIQCSSSTPLARTNKGVCSKQSVRIYVGFLTILNFFFCFLWYLTIVCWRHYCCYEWTCYNLFYQFSVCLWQLLREYHFISVHAAWKHQKTSFGVKVPQQHSSHISERSLFKVLLVTSHLSSGYRQHVFLLTESTCWAEQSELTFQKEPTSLGELVTKGCTVFSGNESQNL